MVGALPYEKRVMSCKCQLLPIPHLPRPREVRTKRGFVLTEEQAGRKVFTWKISITLEPVSTVTAIGIQLG